MLVVWRDVGRVAHGRVSHRHSLRGCHSAGTVVRLQASRRRDHVAVLIQR